MCKTGPCKTQRVNKNVTHSSPNPNHAETNVKRRANRGRGPQQAVGSQKNPRRDAHATLPSPVSLLPSTWTNPGILLREIVEQKVWEREKERERGERDIIQDDRRLLLQTKIAALLPFQHSMGGRKKKKKRRGQGKGEGVGEEPVFVGEFGGHASKPSSAITGAPESNQQFASSSDLSPRKEDWPLPIL